MSVHVQCRTTFNVRTQVRLLNKMETKVKNADENVTKKRNQPNILSRIFLCWVLPVIYKGNIRDVEESDLINPPKKYDSDLLGDRFER